MVTMSHFALQRFSRAQAITENRGVGECSKLRKALEGLNLGAEQREGVEDVTVILNPGAFRLRERATALVIPDGVDNVLEP
jgi:hypothetical protein